MKWIIELHQRHLNKPIWIVGAGPSTDSYPDDFLDNKLGITLHNGYLKFPDTAYRYANEPDRVRWFKENRPEYLDKVNIFAYPFYLRNQPESEAIVDLDRDDYYFFILRPNKEKALDINWVENKVIQAKSASALDFGGRCTCLHGCMYTAIMMGCNPINIIGCEHKAELGKPEYFSKAEKASKTLSKRHHVQLGKFQEGGTLALIEACKRQNITVNRYFNYSEIK